MGMAAVVGVAVVVASSHIPESMAAAIAFERGGLDEQHARYAEAAEEYRKVVKSYPDSVAARTRLRFVKMKLPGAPADLESTMDQLRDWQPGDPAQTPYPGQH